MTTRKFNHLLVSLVVTITLLTNAYPQSARTVMVQSNSGVVLYPTNLFTANAGSARSGLSLASHATNPIIPLTNGGTGTTNPAVARTNFGLIWSGLTNADAAGFRSALSLGTAATNPATAFQPASSALTNLAFGDGTALTNIPLSGVISALATNGNGSGLTNLTAANVTGTVALASNVTGTVALASNVTGTIAISNGGTGAIGPTSARVNLGLGWSALTNTNSANALLGYNTTNGQVIANTGTLTFTNAFKIVRDGFESTVDSYGIAGEEEFLSFEENTLYSSGEGIFQWGAGGADYGKFELWVPLTFNGGSYSNYLKLQTASRANLGFSTNLNSLWVSTNAVDARSAVGLGTNDQPVFNGASITGDLFAGGLEVASGSNSSAVTSDGIEFTGVSASTTRTNLGLPLPALTNTSNVTMMRALAGSTNTNEPYSGYIELYDGTDTYGFTFTNGILRKVDGPL